MRRAGVALLLTAACSAGTTVPTAPTTTAPTTTPIRTPSSTVTATTAAAVASAVPADCSSYRAADPNRPVVNLNLTVDRAQVSGTERVLFTPDLAVTQLVFRLWASAPRPAKDGGSSAIVSAAVNGKPVTFTRPGPTLVRLPYRGRAGTPVTIDLSFTAHLPTGANDRFGSHGTTTWFASAQPLLAWERGRGWDTEPPTSGFAEASTSEDFRLATLVVHHAAGLSVLATGAVASQTSTETVTSAPAVRDVMVAVAAFRRVHVARSVPVDVGISPDLKDDAAAVGREVVRAMRSHVRRFGPFPYEHLAVAVIPDVHGGIEYPGAILLGTGQIQDATASHEVAHEWFYGLVGDDQARDPWLDESFATYAEGLDRGTSGRYRSTTVPPDGRGRTGAPMTYWEGRPSYFRSVYIQGAAALLTARAAAPAAFDQQVRCYLARNAHRIATPGDVAASIPLAIRALRTAGALP
jgi:hypothetical protein